MASRTFVRYDKNATLERIGVPLAAGEALVGGNLVYIKSDGLVWKAVGTAAASVAIGIVRQDVAVGGAVSIFRGDIVDGGFPASTYTPGAKVYLSAASAGATTVTAPATTTNIVQQIGFAVSDTAIAYHFGTNYTTVP